MKFHISSTLYDKYCDKLLDVYPCLTDFGFGVDEKLYPKISRVKDEYGKYITSESYAIKREPFVEINTLEELLELIRLVDNEVIVNNDPATIEIYDGYRDF